MAVTSGLMQRGLEVVSAGDAVYAQTVARLSKPNAVVINSQLAGGGGVVALKRIRSNVHTTYIPVIAVVGQGATQERQLMLSAGAQECLEQPVDASMLVAAIQKHMLDSLDFTQAPAEILAAPQRLAALAESGLLDGQPEASYDALTKLTSRLLGAPTALMSLVDKNRQFFKSQVGLAQPWAEERQTRLSHSFCQWVVSGKEQLIVEDAREHPVLRSNLAIKDMGVIAYAGVPLEYAGQAIGSLCAIDSKPRSWSEEEMATLQDLAVVTEAYATMHQSKNTQPLRGKPAAARNSASLQACGATIRAVTQILHRHRGILDAVQSIQLLDIIKEQSRQLNQMADAHTALERS
jgi:CheY-like chemotaxis protein